LLKVEEIHTYYGESYILQGISLEIGEGMIVGILGRNGMGKTTLIRSIIGFTPPRRGRVIFKGVNITHKRPFQIARLGISIVPQGRQIFSSLDVYENLTIGMRVQYGTKNWTLDKIFELFPPLEGRIHQRAISLSGGEQQMLAIARSLMTNPSFLLMDEPTEGLAPIFVQKIGHVVQTLKQSGISILLVEQNLNFALKYTDYIHILDRGRIVYSSLPRDLDQNHEIKTRHLGV